jgi:hypothetical protein
MGWERRGKGGRMVYYRVDRTAEGKVVKQHLGRGDRAVSAAAAVENATARRQADLQTLQAEQARLAGPDSLIEELVAVTESLMTATLLASGYHRQNYGRWRKRHGKDERNRAATRPRNSR